MKRQNYILIMILLSIVLVAVIILSLGVGPVYVAPDRVIKVLLWPSAAGNDPADISIIRDLRLPRILLATLVGAGLAAAGAAFQGLFRNPLADPFVIGASGGASLGATLAIILGLDTTLFGFGPVPLAAFAGTIAAVFLVYSISQTGSRASSMTLLLAGASLSTVLTSIVSFLMLVSDREMHEIFAWLMGGFGGRSWPHLWSSAPYLILGWLVLWLLARPLDALACGDDTAQTVGLHLHRARGAVIAAASLTTAAAVAAGGIIGFVGLVAPHIARLFFGASHHRLIPASALCGALLLLLADDIARTILAPVELPTGIITSLIGGSFFLYLLKTRQQDLRGIS
jgi:iron complex transport system permease protein